MQFGDNAVTHFNLPTCCRGESFRAVQALRMGSTCSCYDRCGRHAEAQVYDGAFLLQDLGKSGATMGSNGGI